MKVTTFTSSKSVATDYYRSIGPLSRLSKLKGFIHEIKQQENAMWHDIYNTDIILIQRPNSTASLGIMADAKRLGKKVIIDFDDHLLQVPEDNPASVYFSNQNVQKQIIDTFQFADAVFVSTKKLYDLYIPYLKDKSIMFIIPNGWNPTDLPKTELLPKNNVTRFMWRGGSTHFADLHTVKNEINELICMNTEFTFFGIPKFMAYDFHKNANFIEWSNMFVYFQYLKNIEADFGFYPLVRNDFNLCKSNIFAIECIMNGTAVIADEYFSEFCIPGVSLYNSNKSFKEIAISAMNGDIDKVALVKEGRKYISENLHIDLLNEKRWKVIKGL